MRTRDGIPSLRCPAFVEACRESLAEVCDRGDFRVVHYSIQTNHLHLIVEAEDKHALARGMKAVSGRITRCVNRVFTHRGRALDGRYYVRSLESPLEVRRALAYVLLNVRRHFAQRTGTAPPVRLDVASSGPWFRGWARPGWARGWAGERAPVAEAKTWLLAEGWKRHGLIDPAEVPGGSEGRRL